MKIIQKVPPLILLCAAIVAFFILIAAFAGPLALRDVDEVNLSTRFEPPAFLGGSWDYPLGTDGLGHDMVSLTLRGIQVSITIALIGTVGGAILGTTLGLLAAWTGGVLDNVIGFLIDLQATIPTLILILAFIVILPSSDFAAFMGIMILYGWERYARLSRAIGLSARSQPYVQAQQILGASAFRIVTRSVLPNAMAVLLVNMSVHFPQTILLETTLNFLGLGVQPPDTSLGVLIGAGRDQLYNSPWVVLIPSVIILLMTISVSILGDWVRDRVESE